MKKPPVAGIPTAYKGVHFRSRLEATWAAFLDKIGMDWKYEPFDLKGYIPDFALENGKTLLEVKPALTMHELWAAVEKVEKSGWTGRTLIVGAAFPLDKRWLGLGGDFHGWGYAQVEHLSTGLVPASAAWKEAQNETQWFPSVAVKAPKRRKGKFVVELTQLQIEAAKTEQTRTDRLKWLRSELHAATHRDLVVAFEESVYRLWYEATAVPPTLHAWISSAAYQDVLIRDCAELLAGARRVSSRFEKEPVAFQRLIIHDGDKEIITNYPGQP